MIRRRLGLRFTVLHSHPERNVVVDVSGQPLVPSMAVDDDKVLNDILEYVDATCGSVAEEASPGWRDDPAPPFRRSASERPPTPKTLMGISLDARRQGDVDTAKVLESEAKGVRETARWTKNRIDGPKRGRRPAVLEIAAEERSTIRVPAMGRLPKNSAPPWGS